MENTDDDGVIVGGPSITLAKLGRFGPYTDLVDRVANPVVGVPFHSVRNRFHQLKNQSQLARGFIDSIEFHIFLDDETPQARAWIENGRRYVGITLGLVHLIEYYFLNIFSIKGVLTEFPESEGEEEVEIGKLKEGFFIDKMLKTAELNPPFRIPVRIPKSRLRQQLAGHLATSAIEFILWHEIGHCFYEHTKILNEVYGVQQSTMAEWIPQSELCEPQDARHLFELQADSFALSALCSYALPNRKALLRKPERIDDYAIWSFAIDSLFWIFSQELPLGKISVSHPHPQMRAYNKLQVMQMMSHGRKFPTVGEVPLPVIKFFESAHTLANYWAKLSLPGNQWLWVHADNREKIHSDWIALDQRTTDLQKAQAERYYDRKLYKQIMTYGGWPPARGPYSNRPPAAGDVRMSVTAIKNPARLQLVLDQIKGKAPTTPDQ
jgi:hypothetical protein